MDSEHLLNNGMGNCTFALDDAHEKLGLDSWFGPICLKQAWFRDLKIVRGHDLGNCLYHVKFR